MAFNKIYLRCNFCHLFQTTYISLQVKNKCYIIEHILTDKLDLTDILNIMLNVKHVTWPTLISQKLKHSKFERNLRSEEFLQPLNTIPKLTKIFENFGVLLASLKFAILLNFHNESVMA